MRGGCRLCQGSRNVPLLAQAGNVVGSFPSGLSSSWGLAYDTGVDRLWLSNFAGDGLEHEYLPDGTQTGNTIDIQAAGGFFQADGTYNGRTGMLWQVNVGGDNCLFEMDPVAKVVTGNKICGSWSANTSQRAVAYDYVTDTYYVGGTNEAVVYHIDGSATFSTPRSSAFRSRGWRTTRARSTSSSQATSRRRSTSGSWIRATTMRFSAASS